MYVPILLLGGIGVNDAMGVSEELISSFLTIGQAVAFMVKVVVQSELL